MNEKEIMEKFVDLACRLSPENLSCDGEAPRSYINRKLRQIKQEWRELEMKLGKSMSETEVWNWSEAQYSEKLLTHLQTKG